MARTPLPHLLVYTHDRALTGTFEFRAPDGTSASMIIVEGRPAKARLTATPIYLGQVLLEIGAVGFANLTSAYAVVRLWGGGVTLAYAVQSVVSCTVIASIGWRWRSADRQCPRTSNRTVTRIALRTSPPGRTAKCCQHR